jgi:hypothetical protein
MQVVIKTTQVVDNVTNCKECPLAVSFDDDEAWSADGKTWYCGVSGGTYGGMYSAVPEDCPAQSGIFKETVGKQKIVKVVQVRK